METALTSKQGRPVRAGWWVGACALVGLVASLSGCVTTSTTKEVSGDVKTDSDQTDVDRRARVRMELAAAYFGRGQFSTALDEVKLALQARPEFADAYNLRGLIYAGMGETGLAEDSFRRALQLAPRDADTMHNYGWFLCQNRRFADAEVQFRAAQAVPNYRDVTRTLLAQGVCQARNNQWVEAEKTLLRSYELDPTNPVVALNLAEVLVQRGDFERARFYVRRVNSVDEQISSKTLWLAVRIEHKLGQTAQVQLLGNQLVNRFPQSPEALQYEKGRYDE
jgi:type IV pilus assembly protein PilF